MKYLTRAVKYFFYFVILTTLIIIALIMTGLAESDIELLFNGGYSAIWKMLCFFILVGAVYPKIGFISRKVTTEKPWDECRETVINYLREHQFTLESENGGKITFRHKSALHKLTRMYEDRITVTLEDDGFSMEGLRKDVFRLSTGLEYRLNPVQQD